MAARHLRCGGIVAFPTETVYGLAAGLRRDGIGEVYFLKGRLPALPLPLQMESLARAEAWGFEFSAPARRIAARAWPGPLTMVLPRPAALPAWFAPEADGIALRIPDHPIALALLRAMGTPLAVTSANHSGRPPARSADETLAAFPDAEGLIILDGGPNPGGLASTVLDVRGKEPIVLRKGPFDPAAVSEHRSGPAKGE